MFLRRLSVAARRYTDLARSRGTRHRVRVVGGVVASPEASVLNQEWTFLDLIPDAVIVVDRVGTIVEANALAERAFGYARADLVGRPVEILLDEDLRSRHVHERAQFVAEGKTRPMGIGLDLAARRSDGSTFAAEISLSRVETSEGQFVVSVLRDISERKQAEQAEHRLLALNAELERRVAERTAQLENTNRELEAFSYSVAHDLRAPLRGIDGFSQAIEEDYATALDATGRDYLSRIRMATQRMGQLIDDLLSLSRLSRLEISWSSVDLSALARASAEDLRQSAPNRNVTFAIAEGLTVRGDARLLRIAVENLLANAWKFTSKHPSARIELGRDVAGGPEAFFVRDDGAGFDMAHVSRLFGPFQRLHPQAEFPGTGIGLVTVQRIIHRHGGTIRAEAAIERGATFWFTIGTASRIAGQGDGTIARPEAAVDW